MGRLSISLVAGFAAIAGVGGSAAAEDGPASAPATGAGTTVTTARPGGLGLNFGAGALDSHQTTLHGKVDLDGIYQNNYTDGNDNLQDHRDVGLIRAELGVDLQLQENIEFVVTLAYQGESGDTPDNAPNSKVVLDDAYLLLKEFFSPSLSLKVGRQARAWNLRSDHGAFLFDSRADHPAITGWDGATADYSVETLIFHVFGYQLPDKSKLSGLVVDWQPDDADGKLFVTGSVNLQRDVALKGGGTGDQLRSFYAGAEWKFDSGLDLYGEGAIQNGKPDAGSDFSGYGYSVGADLHLRSLQQSVLGVQYDSLSGDSDPSDGKNHAFINPYEGVSDTYIVENEKYGELSRLVQGGLGLHAAKAKFEVALDDLNRVRLKAEYGYYTVDKTLGGVDKYFGQEADLALTWRYTPTNATISLFGGVFFPGDTYRVLSAAYPNSGRDRIYLLGANLLVSF